MNLEERTYICFEGFLPYVANRNKRKYKDEFANRKQYTQKFALQFFPKYVNFEKHIKNPKEPYDTLLFNYWLIEVPVLGIANTALFKSYVKGNVLLNKTMRAEKKGSNKVIILKPKKSTLPKTSTLEKNF